MTLQQIFDLVNKKTYFSRDDDEIWAAISNAASTIYLQIVSENSGFFRVTDTTTVTLVANQEEYTLPPQLGEMIRVRESTTGNPRTDPWRVIQPADVNDDDVTSAQFGGVGDPLDTSASSFVYVGPYLDNAAAATATQTQKFSIAPIPVDSRHVELIYLAKFVDITDSGSPKVMPNESDGAVMWSAIEEILVVNDDDNHENASAQKEENLRWLLKWVRNRQFQQVRQVEPYVEDMD